MKAVAVFLLVLCAVWFGGSAIETRSQSAFVDSGDTNADGIVDMTDAVLILHHLFLGGPAPVRIPIAEAGSNDALEARVAALERASPPTSKRSR